MFRLVGCKEALGVLGGVLDMLERFVWIWFELLLAAVMAGEGNEASGVLGDFGWNFSVLW